MISKRHPGSRFEPLSLATSGPRTTTRLLAWNIRAGGGGRIEGIFDQITRWAPQVLVLSEFRHTTPSRTLARSLAQAGWSYQRSTTDPMNPARNGLLIASRDSVRRVSLRRPTPDDDRWLAVSTGSTPDLSIAGIHIPNRSSGRKSVFLNDALAVARRWRPGPALIIGDTNSGRIGIDEEAPAFDKREDRWMQSMEAAGWRDAFRFLPGDRREFTWYSPIGRNGFRLDQAFLNPPLQQHLRRVRHAWGSPSSTLSPRREVLSDHAALLLDFDLLPTANEPRPHDA